MQHTAPVDVNPQEMDRATNGWANFTQFAKYGVIAIVVLLILMATFLL